FRGEIVGVVSDVRIYGQTNEVPDQMYFSIRQSGAGFSATQMRLVARVQGDPTAITPQVRAVLRGLDPDVPLASVEPMEDILSGSIRDVRFRAGLVAGNRTSRIEPDRMSSIGSTDASGTSGSSPRSTARTWGVMAVGSPCTRATSRICVALNPAPDWRIEKYI